MYHETTLDKNLKTIDRLWFWHTCDPEIRSRYELQDPEQGYTHTKFERPTLNSIHQKTNTEAFIKSENTSIISLECVQKWKTVVYLLFSWLT